MSSYKPPYTLTSKMVNLISAISEEITRVEYNKKEIITSLIEEKRVLGTYQEILEVGGTRGYWEVL